MKKVYWTGYLTKCQVCNSDYDGVMYDMKTKMGPWANLCHKCAMQGVGVGKTGTGFGQKYEQQKDGKWLKVQG